MWTSYVAPVLSPALLYRTKCAHAVQQQYRIRACLVDGPKPPKGKILGGNLFGVQTMCACVCCSDARRATVVHTTHSFVLMVSVGVKVQVINLC